MKYKPDFEQLNRLTDKGFLRKVENGDLVLYNYTNKCTYDRKWNEHTLNARGTIYNKLTGDIVAYAFPKFFNFGELSVSKQRNILKQKDFSISEKVDGSLGICYFHNNKWNVNTRGSFDSDQAIEATKMLDNYNFNSIPSYLTILCEIIYPENKIIVDYGSDRKLVLLGAYNILTREEVFGDALRQYTKLSGLEISRQYKFYSIEELIKKQDILTKQEEGFVVRLKDGYRIKFKSKKYLELAKMASNITPLCFWRKMKNGCVDASWLSLIPEEFREAADKIQNELESKYRKIHSEIKKSLIALEYIYGPNYDIFKKYIGINQRLFKYSGGLFLLIDKKYDKLDSYILKQFRPKGNEMGEA